MVSIGESSKMEFNHQIVWVEWHKKAIETVQSYNKAPKPKGLPAFSFCALRKLQLLRTCIEVDSSLSFHGHTVAG